jgi:hypothetical protein
MSALGPAVAAVAQGLLCAVFAIEILGAAFTAVHLWIYRFGVDASTADVVALCVILLVMLIAPALALFSLLGNKSGRREWVLRIVAASISLMLRAVLLLAPVTASTLPWTGELLSGKRFDVIVGEIWTASVLLRLVIKGSGETRRFKTGHE